MELENNAASGGANGAAANGGAGAASSASVTLPGWAEGQLGKERTESLRADVAKDPDLLKEISAIKGNGELYDSWRALRNSLKGTIRLPKEGDGKEVWDRFYKEIGRPESPDKYAYDRPKLPEGMVYSEQEENWFRELVHPLGLSNGQLKGILDAVNQQRIQGFQAASATAKAKAEAEAKAQEETRQKAIADAQSALKKDWGNDYPARMKKVSETILKMPKPFVDKLQAAGLLRDVEFLRWIDGYSRATAEDRILGLRSEGGEGTGEENIDPRTGRHKLKVSVAKR